MDDTTSVRISLSLILKASGFDVSVAANVNDALKLIGAQTFDVLLSDLHMPAAGDGLTVVSAMRHSNPKAVTFIISGFPEMQAAAAAIVEQTDQVLLKPMAPDVLVQTIKNRLREGAPAVTQIIDVATILEREAQTTIEEWFERVEKEPEVITVRLGRVERCAHLTALFRDLVNRLRHPLPLGTRALTSPAAAQHGLLKREQGYTPAMMVEESRMLQVSIFQTLQHNLHEVDFSSLLVEVMAIADEVDSQLAQAMTSYILESQLDHLPVEA